MVLVNLGVSDGERNTKQEVNVSIKLFFKNAPKGCVTDSIKDTVCYFEISNAIKEFCNKGSFKLLEYLCHGLYGEIRKGVPEDIKIWIRVEKCNTPIDDLLGSTCFEYTDIWE